MIFTLEIQVCSVSGSLPSTLFARSSSGLCRREDRRMDSRVPQSGLCSWRLLIVLSIQGRKPEILV